MGSKRASNVVRALIKLAGIGIAAGSATIAYWFASVTDLAYPIFGSLMLFFIALMVIAAILAILY